jgi:cation diffusion facilitator family transporter
MEQGKPTHSNLAKAGYTVVVAAFIANALIAAAKLFAAILTGSTAMLSEGIHSLVDLTNEGLLFYGLKRSERPADQEHPYGYGRELFFWAMVVSILIFTLGGGVSIWEGVEKVLHPTPIRDVTWNYIVLGIAAVSEVISFTIAAKEARKGRLPHESLWQTVQRSKDPSIFAVVFEDFAAILGIIWAFLGVFLSQVLKLPVLDGVFSILIGLTLGIVALLFMRETKSLLIGEPLSGRTHEDIVQILCNDPDVHDVVGIQSVYVGPRDVVLTIDLNFSPDLSGSAIPLAIDRLEKKIRQAHPVVQRIFIEARALTHSSDPDVA